MEGGSGGNGCFKHSWSGINIICHKWLAFCMKYHIRWYYPLQKLKIFLILLIDGYHDLFFISPLGLKFRIYRMGGRERYKVAFKKIWMIYTHRKPDRGGTFTKGNCSFHINFIKTSKDNQIWNKILMITGVGFIGGFVRSRSFRGIN